MVSLLTLSHNFHVCEKDKDVKPHKKTPSAATSELLLSGFARKPVVPLAMDLVETRPTSSRVDASQENGDGSHLKYHSN